MQTLKILVMVCFLVSCGRGVPEPQPSGTLEVVSPNGFERSCMDEIAGRARALSAQRRLDEKAAAMIREDDLRYWEVVETTTCKVLVYMGHTAVMLDGSFFDTYLPSKVETPSEAPRWALALACACRLRHLRVSGMWPTCHLCRLNGFSKLLWAEAEETDGR